MSSKQVFTVEQASHAALMCVMALAQELGRKGVLSVDETNVVFATAVSMRNAGGNSQAAKLIENIVPTCVGVDPIEEIHKPPSSLKI